MSPEEGWLLQIECECKDGRLCSSLHGDTSVRVESKAYLSLLPLLLLQTPHLSGLDQNPQKYPMRASKVLFTREIQPSRPTLSLSLSPLITVVVTKNTPTGASTLRQEVRNIKIKVSPLPFCRYLCNHHHGHQASTRLRRSCHA